tara:strand:+ start:77037 stop:77723 length:687 start_codon:yes stop_codon:yes gene_type:complete
MQDAPHQQTAQSLIGDLRVIAHSQTRHNPCEAHLTLLEERNKPREIAEPFIIEGIKTRSEISPAKKPMLDTLFQVLEDNITPMTVRQIHYQFMNAPPLRHASKPDSWYRNKLCDYKNLVDLVARARIAGLISMQDIKRFNLVPNMEAKKSSSQYQKFYDRYGTDDVFEVEALRPAQLQMLLKEAIDSVMDLDLFNHEREQEKTDAADIEAYRETILKYIRDYRNEESN